MVVNMPPPQEEASKNRDLEANIEGKDDTDGGDSDCQIVDESPRKAQGPKATRTKQQNPQGLWRLKKARDTAITLQLVPVKMGEGTIAVEVSPTPGLFPPGPMQRWLTQDVSQI